MTTGCGVEAGFHVCQHATPRRTGTPRFSHEWTQRRSEQGEPPWYCINYVNHVTDKMYVDVIINNPFFRSMLIINHIQDHQVYQFFQNNIYVNELHCSDRSASSPSCRRKITANSRMKLLPRGPGKTSWWSKTPSSSIYLGLVIKIFKSNWYYLLGLICICSCFLSFLCSFQGQYKSRVMCSYCETKSTVFEPFTSITLQIPENQSKCSLSVRPAVHALC